MRQVGKTSKINRIQEVAAMADFFDQFSIFFSSDAAYVAGKEFPLGQFTTDVLNLDDAVLSGVNDRIR